MNVRYVLKSLLAAKEPSRELDEMVASAVGWSSRTEHVSGNQETTIWFPPGSDKPSRCPHFTSNLNAAYVAWQTVAPNEPGGCSWEDGMGSARIGENGKFIQAVNSSMAVCIAALLLHPDAAKN